MDWIFWIDSDVSILVLVDSSLQSQMEEIYFNFNALNKLSKNDILCLLIVFMPKRVAFCHSGVKLTCYNSY